MNRKLWTAFKIFRVGVIMIVATLTDTILCNLIIIIKEINNDIFLQMAGF